MYCVSDEGVAKRYVSRHSWTQRPQGLVIARCRKRLTRSRTQSKHTQQNQMSVLRRVICQRGGCGEAERQQAQLDSETIATGNRAVPQATHTQQDTE